MKRILMGLCLLVCVGSAYSEKLTSCPSQIVCVREGDVGSCHYDENTWGAITEAGRVDKATYTYLDAQTTYQKPEDKGGHYSECAYHIVSNGVHRYLFIQSKLPLEAYNQPPTTKWSIDGYRASCKSVAGNIPNCPMIGLK